MRRKYPFDGISACHVMMGSCVIKTNLLIVVDEQGSGCLQRHKKTSPSTRIGKAKATYHVDVLRSSWQSNLKPPGPGIAYVFNMIPGYLC